MTRDKIDRPLANLYMHIGKLLRQRVTCALREGGIHFGQSRILAALLHKDKLTQGAIADGLEIKPATVTNQVKKLEAARLVDRTHGENDDRVMNVSLTPEGRKAAKFTVSVMAKIEDEIRSELGPKETDSMRKSLEKVRDKLGGTNPSIPGI